jgi:hypothetical protein
MDECGANKDGCDCCNSCCCDVDDKLDEKSNTAGLSSRRLGALPDEAIDGDDNEKSNIAGLL